MDLPSSARRSSRTATWRTGQTLQDVGLDGRSRTAFGHTGAIAFGSTPTIRFTSDGSLIDSSGDVLNGTLLLGVPNDKHASARAVTIFGATGLIRSWKWNGTAWVN